MYVIRLTVSFFLITLFLNKSEALLCYKCAGPLGKNEACEKDLKKEDTWECHAPSDETPACVTYIESQNNSGGIEIITRSCGTTSYCQRLAARYVDDQTNITNCKTCTKDFCNNGKIKTPLFWTILILIIALLKFE